MTDELIEETPTDTAVTSIYAQSEPEEETVEETVDELDAAFQKFKQSKSEHKAAPEEEREEQESEDFIPDEPDLFDSFKLKIFMGLVFTLLDGIHLFLFKFISKYELKKEDIALDETDQEGLQMYFQSKRVMDFINKIPLEVMGFIHLEYLYFQKYTEAVKAKEEEEEKYNRKLIMIKKLKEAKGEEETETEDQQETKEKPARKKTPRKKAKRKKAVRKKVEPKTESESE